MFREALREIIEELKLEPGRQARQNYRNARNAYRSASSEYDKNPSPENQLKLNLAKSRMNKARPSRPQRKAS